MAAHWFRLTIVAGILLSVSRATLWANEPTADDGDRATRYNPVMEAPTTTDISTASYPFLKMQENKIIMNSHSWNNLANRIAAIDENGSTVSIVHIGDSHVQADGNTGRVRKHLQQLYGNAGRGLIAPLRIAGTNQPLDYKITTTTGNTTATLMRMPWPVEMGFTGVAVHPESSATTYTIVAPSPFNHINIYGKGHITLTGLQSENHKLQYEARTEPWGLAVQLHQHVSSATVSLAGNDLVINGFDLRDTNQPGILYHSIGNNGATYSTYSLTGEVGRGLRQLHPDLVIISLGANEAFGRMTDATFYNNIDALIKEIRRENPDAEFLLTTPAECQRSVKTRTKRGKGRKRRTVTTRTYRVNENVARLRNVIMKYGEEKHIPVYDFYEVAGGAGSSNKWLQSKLLNTDRIHRTWNGYYLEGDLLFHAMQEALSEAYGKEFVHRPPEAVADHTPPEAHEKITPEAPKTKKAATKKKATTTKKKTTKKRKRKK